MNGVRLSTALMSLLPMRAAVSAKDVLATGLPLPVSRHAGTVRFRGKHCPRNEKCPCGSGKKYKQCKCYKTRKWA